MAEINKQTYIPDNEQGPNYVKHQVIDNEKCIFCPLAEPSTTGYHAKKHHVICIQDVSPSNFRPSHYRHFLVKLHMKVAKEILCCLEFLMKDSSVGTCCFELKFFEF